MDPDSALTELRAIANVLLEDGRWLSPQQQYHAVDLIHGLDAWIANGGFLPRDWDPIPPGLVQQVQKWSYLRDERTRVTESEGGELDYESTSQFEQEQTDSATEIANMCCQWFDQLGKLR